jgi:phage regulator Rha-like protein
MAKTIEGQIIPPERIESRIFVLRGHRVMLDRDLAGLYGVATRVLNQAVKRNKDRFPDDFMFPLTKEEAAHVLASRSQTVTLKRGQNVKYAPHVFTEHGAVMLANVLRSRVAIRASIQVVRAFVHLRQMVASSREITEKLESLERKVGKHDADLQNILAILKELLQPPPAKAERKLMGFVPSPERK